MISLLGKHLYSSPHAFLRGLLQNGVDAITARADGGSADPSWSIRVTSSAALGEPFRCTDDGIGMTLAQIQDVLSTVGRSSKRDVLELPISGYLGQFGIGLLSCFMLTDKVVVRTRAAGAPAVEWVGYASGVFTATEIADELPIGTTVEFVPHPDEAQLTTAESLRRVGARYGEYLPVRVEVDGRPINTDPFWARPDRTSFAAFDQLSMTLFGEPALDAIPLAIPGTDLAGTAFVLPYAANPHTRQEHRVYVGGMLVSESCENLLPDWAVFCRCFITTTALNPTASREQLIDDDALAHIRTGLGAAIRRWVEQTARTRPLLWSRFVAVHHLSLRSIAAHDAALAAIIVPWLPFETSAGTMTLAAFTKRWPVVRYVCDVLDFDAVVPLASAEEPVLNAGYPYDLDLIASAPDILPGVAVKPVDVSDMLATLDVPAAEDQLQTSALEKRGAAALAAVNGTVIARVFEPADVTSFLMSDLHLWDRLTRDKARAKPGLWSSMINAIEQSAPQLVDAGPTTTLCLNWVNPTIRHLASADPLVADRIIQVLYCQAAVNAHRPIRDAERKLLVASLDDLLTLASVHDVPSSEKEDPR